MNDLISVIIPVFNREKILKECLDSVIAQSYNNLEIIIIDDGSSDNSVNICKEYAEKDSRFIIFELNHGGVSNARNTGLDNANGEYIFFVDSDDIIHPLLLETLHSAMNESGAEISGSPIMNIGQKNWDKVYDRIEKDTVTPITSYVKHTDALNTFFRVTSPINLIGGVMMRKSLIGETRFKTDLFIGEDFYFVYENLIKNANAIFLEQKWYYCRIHQNNSSNNFDFSAFWSRFYRRELVWKNEAAHGRIENSNIQKNDGFGVFLRCAGAHKFYSNDYKKMRKVLKDYRKELLPAFSAKKKVFYIMFAYIPFAYHLICKAYNILKKFKRNLKH